MKNEYGSADNDVSTALIMTEKEILEMVQNTKDSADFNDKFDNRVNDAVRILSQLQKCIK